ncbi:hypothetical protein D6745_05345 [Candidatus Woesearchaeota archaeon]|nr:MAG: hypothetical protein D6745_05345 [Candidatus Woesearchaeota archaeon]
MLEEFKPASLQNFYENPERYAFEFQVEFLNERLRRQDEIARHKGIVLEDRTLREDYHIFGKAQRIQGNMTPEQFAIYEKTFRLMSARIPPPDLLVYLKADVDTLMERIANRGRGAEQAIPREYIATLNELYEEWIVSYDASPVLVINANQDMNETDFFEETARQIADKVKSIPGLTSLTPGIGEWVTIPSTEAVLRSIEVEHELEAYLHSNPSLITIAGNIGLGKTTLAKMLANALGINGLYEAPEENPLLEQFLGNKPKYCFDLQRYLFQMRAEQRRKGKSGDGSYVKDRSMPEDLLTFCNMFKVQGILTESEYDILHAEFRKIMGELPQADLLIVLEGSPQLAWKRIQERNIAMEVEGGWTLEEIHFLHGEYETYAERVRSFGYHKGPVLRLNVDKIDFTNRAHLGYVMSEILNALKSGK